MTRRGWMCAWFVAGVKGAGAQQPGAGLVILLLGPPGAGKTTQARVLTKRYRIPLLSAAEIVRKANGKKSKISRRLEPQSESGELLSDSALNDLMYQAFEKADHTRGFVLDGYPANRAQVAFLGDALRKLRFPEPVAVIIETPDAVARQRMSARRRADDDPATIERRLAAYRAETELIRESYPAARVFRVDGTKPEAQVSAEIVKLLDASR